eukprot:351375-Chlamydomonas_euryale.AAC.22
MGKHPGRLVLSGLTQAVAQLQQQNRCMQGSNKTDACKAATLLPPSNHPVACVDCCILQPNPNAPPRLNPGGGGGGMQQETVLSPTLPACSPRHCHSSNLLSMLRPQVHADAADARPLFL